MLNVDGVQNAIIRDERGRRWWSGDRSSPFSLISSVQSPRRLIKANARQEIRLRLAYTAKHLLEMVSCGGQMQWKASNEG